VRTELLLIEHNNQTSPIRINRIRVPVSDADSDGEVVIVEGPRVVAAVAEESTLLAFSDDVKTAGPSRAVISNIKLGKTSIK
jgi:hypothetical protein